MSDRHTRNMGFVLFNRLAMVLCCFTALIASDCGGPGDSDGVVLSNTPLIDLTQPADTVLNLNCANVGVFPESCVLDDPENPFVDVVIGEFDENNEDAFNKFDLANAIESGPAGAKARFYFWATALARRPIGENQYFTALALHELYTAQVQQSGFGDPIVERQALKAYRSMLDNFFNSVIFFACFFDDGVFQGCPPPDIDPDDEPAAFALPLNEFVACNLFFQDATAQSSYPNGFERFQTEMGERLGCENAPGSSARDGCYQLAALDKLAEWGYAYQAPSGGDACGEGIVTDNDG